MMTIMDYDDVVLMLLHNNVTSHGVNRDSTRYEFMYTTPMGSIKVDSVMIFSHQLANQHYVLFY